MKFLDRQYGHRPGWEARRPTGPQPRRQWKQPEEVISTTSERERRWREELLSPEFWERIGKLKKGPV